MNPEYDRLLDEIAQGAALHYQSPGDDPDLSLLQGDELYASGLSRLAELGDLQATAVLADAISLLAQAHADGDAELAATLWREHADAVRAIGAANGA